MKPLRVAITGATDLLGRNLLFEIVKQRMSHLDRLEILVLGRADARGLSLQLRMEEILRCDGADYGGVSYASRERFVASVSRIIKYVHFHCNGDPQVEIESSSIDWFFHVAGHMDLRASPAAVATLRCVNVGGTRSVLDLASKLPIGQFCYVGTAYACGNAAGTIQPDCVNPNPGISRRN